MFVVQPCRRLFSTWRSSEASVSAARLRIAEVSRGTLVRDASVNGRVVAAVSPTLYAKASSTVNLKVAAGDTVKKGQVLAVLESPDLADVLKRETSTYEGLKAEVARQQILSRKQKLLARRKPTPPRSSACPPSAPWSATTAWPRSASSPRSTTRRPRTRCSRPRSAPSTPRRRPAWKATTSSWP
jgi:hypothetical protein